MTDDTTPVRTALLGCGRIARMFHVDALQQHPGVSLRAIAEPDAAARRDGLGGSDLQLLDDWRLAIQDPEVDAVVICLPTGLHAAAAAAAFDAGKHAFVEKPLATDAEDARRVTDAWRASGRIGMIGFNARYDPTIERMREILRAERIGRVTSARFVMSAAAREMPTWKRQRATGGGAMLDRGSHVADLVPFVFGRPVVDVSARIDTIRTEGDTATFTMGLDGGPTVQAQVSLVGVLEHRIEVLGEGGRLVADLQRGTLEIAPPTRPYGRWGRAGEGLRAVARGARSVVRAHDPWISHRRILGAFVDAISRGGRPTPDIEDGCRSLEVVLAAETSSRSARVVEIAGARV